MAGDLAFYATILGKPNMSPCWCTWCMLSKLQWNIEGHRAGPEWTVDKIIEIRNNVANGLAEKLFFDWLEQKSHYKITRGL